MGKLTNLNPPAPITDSDIPAAIARDAEVTAAINAHLTAADPHSQYLLQSEGDARYRQNAVAFTDNDIPATIARDAEVTAAINAHLTAADPHSQYLLQSEGDARYRQNAVAFTDNDIPATIARDAEVTAAINAHLTATDPHSQYLLQSEGDIRYRQSSVAFFATAPLPTANVAGNSIAFSWNSVQPGLGTAEFCNFAGLGGGDAFNFFRMPGNDSSSPTLSHRVARIDISGAYIQSSDKRLKSHFSPAPGLETIMALTPLKYTHWACSGFDEEKQSLKIGKFFTQKIGFLAQDVQKVIPEAVSKPTSKEEAFGVDYSCLIACAIKAIQELRQEVIELRAKLH
jgi:predicted FMN-binding regulatory protein PaiB